MTPTTKVLRSVLTVSLASSGVNVAFGEWRCQTLPLSPEWFVAVHASVPAIIALRRKLHLPRWAIPVNIGAAVFGQYVGGKLQPFGVGEFRNKIRSHSDSN
eukprot:m.169720 g.169720  ORF g.169720 m.169720 type:complete len:101 (+) comp31585_c0_seq1:146-448(+)